MRTITKDIQMTIDGSPQGFRLTKPDAFSGVEILRLLLRLQDARPEENPSVLDLILFLPVAAGMWKQHELWDGTYTLDDLLDVAELIQIRRGNEERAAEAVRG